MPNNNNQKQSERERQLQELEAIRLQITFAYTQALSTYFLPLLLRQQNIHFAQILTSAVTRMIVIVYVIDRTFDIIRPALANIIQRPAPDAIGADTEVSAGSQHPIIIEPSSYSNEILDFEEFSANSQINEEIQEDQQSVSWRNYFKDNHNGHRRAKSLDDLKDKIVFHL